MRTISAWVGTFVGFGALASVALAQPFDFTTILSSDSAVPGAPGSGVLIDVGQVVLQDDGAVAAITRFDNPLASTIPAVTFNPTPGNGSAFIVARRGETLFEGSGGTFDEFANLSSVNGNVTFIAEAQASGNLGLFRYVLNAGIPVRRAIYIEGGAIDGHASSLDTGGFTPTAYGVNSAGHVAFGGVTVTPSPSPGTQFVARWHDSGPPIRTVDGTSGLSNLNEPSFSRTFLTGLDTTVFIAHSPAGRGIYAIDAAGLAPVERVEASFAIGADTFAPTRVVGATGTGDTGATLYFANRNPEPADETNQALMLTAGGLTEQLGSYDFDPPSGPPATGFDASAMMSASGRIAALIPDSDGGQAIYHGGTPGDSVLPIAAVGADVGGGFAITALSPSSAAPMVNDNGLVVFDALIGDGSNPDVPALIAWGANFGGPFVVIKGGDTVDIAGAARTILTIVPNLPVPANTLGYDADALKDGLNELNQLAFAVVYLDGPSSEVAVLRAQLPEPSANLLALLGGVMLLPRGRRSTNS